MTSFNKWLDTLLEEKGISQEQIIEIDGNSGVNIMAIENVTDAIKAANDNEQQEIKAMLVRIDFANGDVVHYLKHLAQAIAI